LAGSVMALAFGLGPTCSNKSVSTTIVFRGCCAPLGGTWLAASWPWHWGWGRPAATKAPKCNYSLSQKMVVGRLQEAQCK
jgi:hypothetical protein